MTPKALVTSCKKLREQHHLFCDGNSEARNQILYELSHFSVRLQRENSVHLIQLASELNDLINYLLANLLFAADRFIGFAAKETLFVIISNVPLAAFSRTHSFSKSGEFESLSHRNVLEFGMRYDKEAFFLAAFDITHNNRKVRCQCVGLSTLKLSA